MAVFQEGKDAWEFVVSYANGQRSFGQGTLDNSQTVEPGTPVGLITANSRLVVMDPGATDGSENFAGIAGGFEGDIVTDATSTRDIAILVRDAEVLQSSLSFPAAQFPSQTEIDTAIAAMVAAGIKMRGHTAAGGGAP